MVAISRSSALWLRAQSRVPSLGPGYVVPSPRTVLWTPPTPAATGDDFGLALYVTVGSSHLPSQRVSRTGTDQPPPHATPATPEDSAGRSRSPIPSAAAFPDCPPGRRLRLVHEATSRFACAAACGFVSTELTTPGHPDAAPQHYKGVRATPLTGLKPAS
jgi:hypothetical protein